MNWWIERTFQSQLWLNVVLLDRFRGKQLSSRTWNLCSNHVEKNTSRHLVQRSDRRGKGLQDRHGPFLFTSPSREQKEQMEADSQEPSPPKKINGHGYTFKTDAHSFIFFNWNKNLKPAAGGPLTRCSAAFYCHLADKGRKHSILRDLRRTCQTCKHTHACVWDNLGFLGTPGVTHVDR